MTPDPSGGCAAFRAVGRLNGHINGLLLGSRDGLVWAVGGRDGDACSSAVHVFDPAQGTWRAGPSLPLALCETNGAFLDDGTLLIVGGLLREGTLPEDHVVSAEVFRLGPNAPAWERARAAPRKLTSHSVGLLPDGRVVVAGGYDHDQNDPIALSFVHDPRRNTWTKGANLPAAQWWGVMGWGERLAYASDLTRSVSGTGCFVLDPKTMSWSDVGLPEEVEQVAAGMAVLADGSVALVGGGGYRQPLPHPTRMCSVSGKWLIRAPLTPSRTNVTVAAWPDGSLLAMGGSSTEYKRVVEGGFERTLTETSRAAHIYDPNGDRWVETVSLPKPMGVGRAVTLPDGRVLVIYVVCEADDVARVDSSCAGESYLFERTPATPRK